MGSIVSISLLLLLLLVVRGVEQDRGGGGLPDVPGRGRRETTPQPPKNIRLSFRGRVPRARLPQAAREARRKRAASTAPGHASTPPKDVRFVRPPRDVAPGTRARWINMRATG